jgi:hypothetical protein
MGLGEWMAQLLTRKPPPTEEEVAEKKAVAEELNKKLPTALSGRAAVLKQREKLRRLEEATKE